MHDPLEAPKDGLLRRLFGTPRRTAGPLYTGDYPAVAAPVPAAPDADPQGAAASRLDWSAFEAAKRGEISRRVLTGEDPVAAPPARRPSAELDWSVFGRRER
ncbi:hypothetical protein [Roseisolibacter sp. H3M3-2]|uniref:hypothetical protein n=1 Tax=Roseisolibacter sp. H3M3-2 TaxID=3031323 RepID=UPI0023DAD92A|nr:hypothetical protein [Roseisolibacter sp. H3M3-2]MDF1502470.1 hypothetical protein [Roseisolibacter sp. H3M3-2]